MTNDRGRRMGPPAGNFPAARRGPGTDPFIYIKRGGGLDKLKQGRQGLSEPAKWKVRRPVRRGPNVPRLPAGDRVGVGADARGVKRIRGQSAQFSPRRPGTPIVIPG